MRAVLLLIAAALFGCAANPEKPVAEGKDVRLRLGLAYLAQGKLKLAYPHLQTALTKNPQSLDANLALGQWYLSTNDIDSALSLYQQALSWQPKSGALYNNYAVALCVAGDWKTALTYFDKVTLDPAYSHHARVDANRAECLAQISHDAAQP
ncbi:tetratricopeptide repeat protein [Idiomarina aminovorans]|uniref:tetratricopeptide repeat protein n=1 Tax=Idiomarina aminovorans TaxID=2914829 RepID=UPI00200536A9|nr:tetratricopeptide repeat protein [Idiomarina sp. ATCH4]MCK7459404.1 tetratricopeptide repeat protein [Idiomarina sp. ATCH4]